MTSFPALLLVLNLAATGYMSGLIWFVQLVHYPQFVGVGVEQFQSYHGRHTRFTTLAVGPPMLVEAATAFALLFYRPATFPLWAAAVGAALVLLLWLSTAFIQVPRHNLLASGFDAQVCKSLCTTNWLRTAGWTARGLLMTWFVLQAVGNGA